MRIALMVLLIVISLVLIMAVMLQQGDSNGLSALGGGSDSMYGRKKAKGYDDKLARVTVVSAVVFLIVNVLLVVVTKASV